LWGIERKLGRGQWCKGVYPFSSKKVGRVKGIQGKVRGLLKTNVKKPWTNKKPAPRGKRLWGKKNGFWQNNRRKKDFEGAVGK